VIFGWGKKKKEEEEEEEEIELVTFKGSLNKVEPDLKENAKLVQAGLVRAKELVTEALAARAEMIRLEPRGQASIASFYVDGVPNPGARLTPQQGLAVTQMLKLLAGLDIKERKANQSGGINANWNELPWEVRIDSQPMKEGGERLLVRLRNTKIPFETPSDLGFSDKIRERIRELAAGKQGIILCAGPPLSGLSTLTLAVVRGIDAYMTTIYVVFDANRDIPHVAHFKAEPGDDLRRTIVRAKRAEAEVMYMEPLKTAELAKIYLEDSEDVAIITEFQAKDAADAIVRFNALAGDKKLVAERLKGVFSQKLVRLLCDKCRQAFRPNPKLLEKVGLPPETKVLYRQYVPPTEEEQAAGEEEEVCEKCGGTGFYGRAAMVELIENNEAIKPLIEAGADAATLKAAAKKQKFPTLQMDGLRMVAQGKTSLEELQRVFKEA
jgi:type II secretory ATPase GspE/PulE/Tfp pilus assembly ATPase PilB-like protein